MNPTRCPICTTGTVRLVRADLYDDRYGYPGTFALWRCASCAHQFLQALMTEELARELYSQYYPRAALDLEAWQPEREYPAWRRAVSRAGSAAFRWVPRGVRVLDVGCGFGQSLGYHRRRGCEAHGVDPDVNILRVAERFGLQARAGVFRPDDYPAGYFDTVTLDQVIEHVADPVEFLRGAARVLRPGGTILLATPNGRSLAARLLGARWVHWHAPYHLHLFSRRSLAAAARSAGLEVAWMRGITNPRWYGFQWLHLLSRPPAGTPSVFWSPGRTWPAGRALLRCAVSAAGRLGVNHVVAFGLDLCGAGDNLVLSLRKPRE
jgi:2-polyprenyl-3-methyl-5-hydroxy-6-metoxy-1,4-benzoquinol methylase